MPEENQTLEIDTDELRTLVAEVMELPVDEITDGARFTEDLGVDSLILLDLGLRLEERFGVRLSDQELKEIDSFGALGATLTERLAAESAP